MKIFYVYILCGMYALGTLGTVDNLDIATTIVNLAVQFKPLTKLTVGVPKTYKIVMTYELPDFRAELDKHETATFMTQHEAHTAQMRREGQRHIRADSAQSVIQAADTTLLQKAQETYHDNIKHKIDLINHYLPDTWIQSNGRSQRHIFASILSPLTGLAKSSTVHNLQKTERLLATQTFNTSQRVNHLGTEMTSFMQISEAEFKTAQNKMKELKESQRTMRGVLISAIEEAHDATRKRIQSYAYGAQLARTFLTDVIITGQTTLETLTDVHDGVASLANGRLPRELCPEAQLTKLLQEIQQHIDEKDYKLTHNQTDYYYRTNVVSYLRNPRTIVITLDIPLSREENTFLAHDILSVPIVDKDGERTVTIKINNDVLAINSANTRFIEMTYTTLTRCERFPERCEEHVETERTDKPSCNMALFKKDIKSITKLCHIGIGKVEKNFTRFMPVETTNETTLVLVSSNEGVIQLSCKGKTTRQIKIPVFSTVNVPRSCILKSVNTVYRAPDGIPPRELLELTATPLTHPLDALLRNLSFVNYNEAANASKASPMVPIAKALINASEVTWRTKDEHIVAMDTLLDHVKKEEFIYSSSSDYLYDKLQSQLTQIKSLQNNVWTKIGMIIGTTVLILNTVSCVVLFSKHRQLVAMICVLRGINIQNVDGGPIEEPPKTEIDIHALLKTTHVLEKLYSLAILLLVTLFIAFIIRKLYNAAARDKETSGIILAQQKILLMSAFTTRRHKNFLIGLLDVHDTDLPPLPPFSVSMNFSFSPKLIIAFDIAENPWHLRRMYELSLTYAEYFFIKQVLEKGCLAIYVHCRSYNDYQNVPLFDNPAQRKAPQN